ncbi:MAG: hypothetical protein RI904_2394, partial [Pseudomonadota bacterium]
ADVDGAAALVLEYGGRRPVGGGQAGECRRSDGGKAAGDDRQC